MSEKRLIGRSDLIDLPELGLYDVPAKVDTGAFTSAIHCHRLAVEQVDGRKRIRFALLDPAHPAFNDRELMSEDFELRKITSSNGQTQRRYVIRTRVRLFGRLYEAHFSLASREKMKFPILIGRRFLQSRFVVDCAQYNLAHKHKLKGLKPS